MAVKLTKKEKKEVRNKCIQIIMESLGIAFLLAVVLYYVIYDFNAETIELLKAIESKEMARSFCWIMGPIFFIVISSFQFVELVIRGVK